MTTNGAAAFAPKTVDLPRGDATAPIICDHRPVVTARVAVFTNAYPAISHTFIRNEIIALERLGIDVARITIRRSSVGLIDPADRLEATRTFALLGEGHWSVLAAIVARFRKAPRRFLTTLLLTIAEPQRAAGPFRNIAYFVEACRLAEIVDAQHVRHIHAHFGTNPAAIARLAARLANIGYSFTVHGPDEFDAPRQLNLSAKIADARFVVAISDFGRSQLLRWSRLADWPKIAVSRCGVASTFRETTDNRGLHSRTFVCVARLSAQKGLSVLIEAAAILAEHADFALRIIGDGELRTELETQIARLGLTDRVTLVGWLPSENVREEISNARAFVLPSFGEGLPIVLMEALALGRPVVATAIAGIPELVDDATGWLVRAGSAPVLAAAMQQALDASVAHLEALGAVGRARVRANHDVDHNSMRIAELLACAME